MQPAIPSEAETISLVYDGGLAGTGQLQFYEFSRASYAFARMIATIEHFRRTGQIAQRINRNSYVNLIIRAPEKGSFPLDILIPIFSEIAKEAPNYAKVPIGVLLKYVAHSVTSYLSPKQEKEVLAAGQAFVRMAEETTKQSAQETSRIESIERMVANQNVTTQAALDVIKTMIARPDQNLARIDATVESLSQIAQRLTEHQSREKEFAPYRRDLESIGQEKLVKLTRKIRPQITEVGLPLRNSADVMKLTSGRARNVFATYDWSTLAEINSKSLDAHSTKVEIRIPAYDRDTGVGKCDILEEQLRRVAFSVPVQLRTQLRRKIVKAMDADAVIAQIRYFRNKDNSITALQLEDVLLDAPLDFDQIDEED